MDPCSETQVHSCTGCRQYHKLLWTEFVLYSILEITNSAVGGCHRLPPLLKPENFSSSLEETRPAVVVGKVGLKGLDVVVLDSQ